MYAERTELNQSFGWWACYVKSAHVGPNRTGEEHWIFVFSDSATGAVDQLYKARGWKKALTYDICKLTPEGQVMLEEIMRGMGKKIYEKAHEKGFYGRRRSKFESQIEKLVDKLMQEERLR